MFLTAFVFLLVLSILVLVHEAGHFFVAKKLGVKVEEFGFGFPPRIFGKRIGETLYSINALPIGGFVKLFGEDEAGSGRIGSIKEKALQVKGKDRKRAFFARPVWQRASIVVAGVIMNFILAVIIISYLFTVQGVLLPGNTVTVESVSKNTPADKVGLKPGDSIIAVGSIKIVSSDQLISITKKHLGEQLILHVRTKDKKEKTLIVTPRIHYPVNEGALGIAITSLILKKYPWYEAPFVGTWESLKTSWLIVQGLYDALKQLIIGRTIPKGLAGPVGIAQLTGETVKIGFDAVLSLIALLSLNLAIMNILPIPALDGGRLFFIVLEGIIGKKIHPKYEGYAHAIGMAILLTLILFITLHDILRVITKQPLIQ
jgi:regulator of sigma E protease